MTPAVPTGAPVGAVTYDGSKRSIVYGSSRVDTGEYVPELLDHRSAVDEYARIGRKSHLASLRRATRLVAENFTVWLDQGQATDATTARVAGNLGVPVASDGDAPDVGGLDFAEHMSLALDAPIEFGHAYFEGRAARRESGEFAGAMWLGPVEPRPQNTLMEARVGRDGSLIELEQRGFDDPRSVFIPASAVIGYRHNARPGDPWGEPLLRACWEAEFFRQTATVLAMENLEFGGTGVLHLEWTREQEPTAEQLAWADQIAAGWKTTGKVVSTGGWRASILSPTGQVDALALIKHHEQKASAAFMAGVLELGTTGQGNRALGDTFSELWVAGVASIVRGLVAQMQRQLVRRIVDWNEGPDAPAPVLRVHTGMEVDVLSLPDMAAAADAGLVQVSMDLVAANHRRHGLPAPVDDDIEAPAGQVTAAAACGCGDPHHIHAAALRREPSKVEAAARVDFTGLDERWRTETERLAAFVDAERRRAGAQLAAAAAGLVESGRLAEVADIEAPVVGEAVLEEAYVKAVAAGAADHVDEAAAQGVRGVSPRLGDAQDAARQAARATAALIGAEVKAAVVSRAIGLSSASPSDVADALVEHVESLSDASVIQRVGGGLVSSTGEGRVAAMQAAEDAGPEVREYYGSSLLDGSTCGACAADDGRTFDTLDDALAVYPSGAQNASCEGGDRCRCLVVAVYSNETPSVVR